MTEYGGMISRLQVEAGLIARAWQDEAFLKELLSSPREVFERELGSSGMILPEQLAISVVEETPNQIYLIMPVKPDGGPVLRSQFEAGLIGRAWQDEALMKELVSDPNGVYRRELGGLGRKVPEDFNITVLKETPEQMYMALPVKPAAIEESEELSDEALSAVAGGRQFVILSTDRGGKAGFLALWI